MQQRFRLRRNEDFARLRRDGRTYRHPLLSLTFAPNGLSHNRYGFVTSRHLGMAVVRNRVRRQLRESVRLHHAEIRVGFDLVFIARQPIVGQPFLVVQRIVSELAQRAGLLGEADKT
jgi:ribonuclease P protein component